MDISEPQDTAKAALIVFQNLRPKLLQYSSNPAKLSEIVEPISGFEWNKRSICALGTGPIDDLMKNSKAPKPLTERLRRTLITTYFDEPLISPHRVWHMARTRNPLPHMGHYTLRGLD